MEKLSTVDKIELIARYEIRHNTSEPDRITEWFGDYAMYASKKLDREEMNNIFATKFVKLLLDEWFNGFRGEKSIEKEFFEHISRLNSECFKNSLPNNLEDWEKAIINELEGVSKQVASGNIPILQERTKIYIDMDGTIARFHDENLYLERMFEKGFFIDLKPFENAVYIGVKDGEMSLSKQIGVISGTDSSLSNQHKDIEKFLKEDIEFKLKQTMTYSSDAYRLIETERQLREQREKLLNCDESKLSQAIDDISAFKNLWVEKNYRIQQLSEQVIQLQEERQSLERTINEKNNEINKLKEQIEKYRYSRDDKQTLYR